MTIFCDHSDIDMGREANKEGEKLTMHGRRSGVAPTCLSFICPKGGLTASIMCHIAGKANKAHYVLPSEVSKIPAKISNPKVLWLQGNHDAWPEGG